MSETLWDEFDAMASNLREQAYAPGVSALEGRTMLNVAARIRDALHRYAGTAEGRPLPETETRQTPLVLYPDLVDALKRARTKVNQEWQNAHEQSRIALSGAAYALDYLARELVSQDRDGAGAHPATEPTAATATPAPSRPEVPPPAYVQPCGQPHPWMDNAWCTLNPHPDKRHEAQSADTYRTVVGWTEL